MRYTHFMPFLNSFRPAVASTSRLFPLFLLAFAREWKNRTKGSERKASRSIRKVIRTLCTALLSSLTRLRAHAHSPIHVRDRINIGCTPDYSKLINIYTIYNKVCRGPCRPSGHSRPYARHSQRKLSASNLFAPFKWHHKLARNE